MNKEHNSNIIIKKEKISIENNNDRNKVYNTVNNKKKNIKIINCEKVRNKFIQKSNSFLGKKIIKDNQNGKKIISKINQTNNNLNTSFKKLPNKNKNNDRPIKNNDFTNRTNDRPKNIVVKIDLTKI